MSGTPRLVPRTMLREPGEPIRIEMADGPMADLVASIQELGILKPLLVSPIFEARTGDECLTPDPAMGRQGEEPVAYEIIDGHRRYLAAGFAELDKVPVMIFQDPGEARYAMMLHANICNEALSPYEEGVQFVELATRHEWSMDQLQRVFHKSEDYINDRVMIATKDMRVADACRDRLINVGQAKEILKCPDQAFRGALLEQAAVHGATIRSLAVMRHNRESEERAAQGQLPINGSPQFVAGAVLPTDKCIWCGNDIEPGNGVTIQVHNYHQKDVDAVLSKVGLRALLTDKGKVTQ